MCVCVCLQEVAWGIAYKVHPSAVPEVMAYLDHREKGGYSTHRVSFHPCDKDKLSFTVLVYIGTETNEEYLGPAPLDSIARQVVGSRGPSGCNVEYVLNLARAMRESLPHVEDKHLFSLEERVRELLAMTDSQTDGHSAAELVCTTCEYHSHLLLC